MIADIFSVAGPPLVCTGVGYLWGRLDKPFDAGMVTGLAINLGVPCLIFSTLTRLEVSIDAFAEMAGAYTLALVCFLTIAAALTRLLRLDARTYVPALTFRNSGNLGLPICLFAFGEAGLSFGICAFVIASLSGLTIGRGIYAGFTASEALLRNPLAYAILISVAFMAAGIGPPEWLSNTVAIFSGLAIPLMLISLGVALSKLEMRGYGRALALSALGLVIGLGVGLALADLFGLTGAARGVLVLQCSMPVAIHNHVFAQRYGRAPDVVAGMVLTSTLLAFGFLPFVLWIVL